MVGEQDTEGAIRGLIENFVNAIRAKDLDGVMSAFAPNIVSFDLGPPLQHGGGEGFRARWQELFNAYDGEIDYRVEDLHIVAGVEVAFSYSLNNVRGTIRNGPPASRWLRWTACYRKTGDRWLIVHEQVSVPVDVKSSKALLDLQP